MRTSLQKIAAVFIFTFSVYSANAQVQPEFIKQVAGVYAQVEMGGYMYFTTSNELWKSDGTPTGTTLVKLFQNPIGQIIPKLVVLNNKLIFHSSDGTNGRELWISDGTTTGTEMLKDINPTGDSHGNVDFFVIAGNTLFFNANDGVNGVELWKTDGTSSGTVMVKDINPGPASSYPQFGIMFNNELYFDAADGTVGRELFKSDGTTAGTGLLKDIGQNLMNPGFPSNFRIYNNELYFTARPLNGEFWLHKTDGTANGTVVVNNQVIADSYELIIYNNNMYFSGYPATNYNDKELYKSDGTLAGTSLVGEINTTGASNPNLFTLFNGKLFFTAITGSASELYSTDGTTISLVKDIIPGTTGGGLPYYLTATNNFLYFTADDNINGRELWASDGTTAGTNMLVDFNPGASGSNPLSLFIFNNELYFTANNGSQSGLWKIGTTSTGIDKLNQSSLRIFPNPAKHNITIASSSSTLAVIISIIGETLAYLELNGETTVDISAYAPGIYFIRTSEGQTLKFIKE